MGSWYDIILILNNLHLLALASLKAARKIDSDNYLVFLFQGKAHTCLKQYEKSERDYQRCVEIDSSNVLAWKVLKG